MLKRQLGTLFLVTCLSLTTIPSVLGAQSTITVNPTSGTDAQTAINSAINSVASGATSSNPGYVLLTAGTYKISGPILLKSNVVLKGAGDSTIIFANGSVCNSAGAPAYIFGSDVSNVEISNLQFKSTAGGIRTVVMETTESALNLNSSSIVKYMIFYLPHILYSDGVRIGKGHEYHVYNS